MKKLMTLAAGAVLTIVAAAPAAAWKIETHVWMAMQIQAQAQDGFVQLSTSEKIPVPAYVSKSVKDFPGAFIIGVLGADTYPDMIVGQMTTHPGLFPPEAGKPDLHPGTAEIMALTGRDPKDVERRWMTDDWLNHVRERAIGTDPQPRGGEDTAFAYGYLMHAAMDMWAHTYVNIYSGGVFSLLGNQEIPTRHMAIESFIKYRHPEIVAETDLPSNARVRRQIERVIADPSRLAREPRDYLTNLRAPTDFVRRTLVLNSRVADQYARDPSTLHLWSMYTYWNQVRIARSEAVGVQASFKGAVLAASREVTRAEDAWKAAQGAYDGLVKSANDAYQAFKGAESAAVKAASDLRKAEQDILKVITSLTDQLIQMAPDFVKGPYVAAKRSLKDANEARADAEKSYKRLAEQRDGQQKKANDALKNFNLKKAARDSLQQLASTRLPLIDDALRGWQESLERAVDAYVLAWEDVSKEIMRPKGNRFSAGNDPLEPLRQWVICYGPTFGMPVLPGQVPALCREALNIQKTATQNLTDLLKNAPLDKAVRDEIVKLDKLIADTGGELFAAVGRLLSTAFPLDQNRVIQGVARSIVNLRDKDAPSAEALNEEFRDDISGSQLLKFTVDGGIAKMLLVDMGLSAPEANRSLADLANFAALQNAFKTAQLTLADGAGLNTVVRNRLPLLPGPQFPYEASERAGALLIRAVRSIDGDHQWQPSAPKLPTQSTANALPSSVPARFEPDPRKPPPPRPWPDQFGYEASIAARTGLRLRATPLLRDCVFEKVFAGPLTPGLYSAYPKIRDGFGKWSTNSYPSRADPAADPDERTCPVGAISPVQPGLPRQTPTLQQPAAAPAPSAPTGPQSLPQRQVAPLPRTQ